MSKQIIGTLKNVTTKSKVEDGGRQVHTVTTTVELIEKKGLDTVQEIAKALNKPVRMDFDPVQLELQ